MRLLFTLALALALAPPCRADEVAVGDIVLARVRGWLLVLHQVIGLEPGRFQIGTTSGRSDGWVSAADIFGRVAAVQPACDNTQSQAEHATGLSHEDVSWDI